MIHFRKVNFNKDTVESLEVVSPRRCLRSIEIVIDSVFTVPGYFTIISLRLANGGNGMAFIAWYFRLGRVSTLASCACMAQE